MQLTRSRKRALVAALVLAVLGVVGWVDWRPARPASPPRVSSAFWARGPLRAGAARVALSPGQGVIRAGYPPPRPTVHGLQPPLFARSLVLESPNGAVGLVSLELLEVPEPIAERVREHGRALGLQGVAVTATHIHSSFGGYDDTLLAEVSATGWSDQAIADGVVEAASRSLTLAWQDRRPAQVKLAQSLLGGLVRNRAEPGDAVDPSVMALGLESLDAGEPIGALFVFAAHPTLVPRKLDRLDSGYPGRAMARLEEKGGVALFMQGAVGDQSATPPPGDLSPSEVMGARLAQVVEAALENAQPQRELAMAWSETRLALPAGAAPSSVPRALRRPASNLLQLVSPESAPLAVLRLGSLVWIFLPGEPTSALSAQLVERLSPLLPGARPVIVGLAQGYLGYLESSDRVRQGRGESRRTLWEADLADRIAEAIAAALVVIEERR